ncbi:MAG TPA: hypothetical protein VEU96_09980 [Bryobacteraceae bacterium]|nr:hypothetical protein [Bryobacteraceae bacterium]
MRCSWSLVVSVVVGMGACSIAALGQGVLTTFAGNDWVFPGDGKAAANAPLGRVYGLTVDRAGNPIVVDTDNCMVARVEKNGLLTVIAGNGFCGLTFAISGNGGAATAAGVYSPYSAAFDPAGNLYISSSNLIRKVSGGIISNFGGTGNAGFFGDGGPAASALISSSGGIASDAAGNIYFADGGNNRIRRIATNGIISTVVGTGKPGNGGADGDGGQAINANLSDPEGLAFDGAGNLFIADTTLSRVRKVTPDGVISTVLSNIAARSVAFDSAGAMYIGGMTAVYKLPPGATTPIVIAGHVGGTKGFGGDGGPVVQALFDGPLIVAPDNAGNLYIADRQNSRLRKVDANGIVTTVAGNGNYRYSGEGLPALASTLNYPFGVAVDTKGAVYFTERASNSNRVRKVSAGVVTTVVGTGVNGFSGDGGQASQATLASPWGLTIDTAGNMYIADNGNGRIRRVTSAGVISTFATVPDPQGLAFDPAGNLYVSSDNNKVMKVDLQGNVTTFAGTGAKGYSGEGGPATAAMLTNPWGLAFDNAGNLYLAEPEINVVRKVTPQGIISTFAGTGAYGSGGDGGPAKSATLGYPTALRFDAAGNLYISGHIEGHIRRVSPAGIISTFAGGGPSNQLGDGKVATSATISIPDDLAFDAAGNLYIADEKTNRIRVVLTTAPSIQVPQTSLSFAGSSGGPTVIQSLVVQGSLAGLDFQVAVDTGTSGKWLSVDATSASTPRLLSVIADPANLAPGNYSATITISPVAATPAKLPVTVTFQVGPALPPKLGADKTNLSFTFPRGAGARVTNINAANVGGGVLNFTASAKTATGGNWLSVSPLSGKLLPGKPVPIVVTADPSGLIPGTYTGSISLTPDSGNVVAIPVVVTVSNLAQALLLTQSGISFTAVAQGGIVPSQWFGVINPGTGVLNWTVSTSTLSGGASWLSASPGSGASDPSQTAPQVQVSVNAANLAPGNYFGQVRIDAPGAANTPQVVTVFLEVLAAGSDPGAVVQPVELVFPATPGNGAPGAQAFLVYNIGASGKSFTTGHTTSVSFQALPQQGVLDPNQPMRVLIQPLGDFAAGTQSAVLTFQFSDGRVQTAKVRVISAAGAAAGASLPGTAAGREAACTPTTLIPSMNTLGDSFSVSAGWPVALTVSARDDCGAPHTAGSVTVNFSNGDPPLTLQSLKDGTWQGTWQTRSSSQSAVTLTVNAVNPQLGISGTSTVGGGFRSPKDPPIFTQGSIGSAAVPTAYQPLAPGSIISIYGDRLADGTLAASTLPLPTQLGNTQVSIAGQLIPLIFVSQFQINAVVPFGLNINTTHQVLVQRGITYSEPAPIDVAAAQPNIFLANGYGILFAARADGTPPFLISRDAPAKAGDILVIYCDGLGATNPAVADGVGSPLSPLAQTTSPVTVSVGGQNAPVLFAGLVPGFVGLYQVNAILPDGVAPGNSVPVTLTVAGLTGVAVTTVVQ